ncbi:hypothetical protein [Paramicrobacterium fandaimingii]|uniref:hypothetical protein n=1 Tax=Paramicrobacterium fandaimingii TaxID=2708079 RepID=UPI001F29B8A5|nr:hypothetical protein [Microbacterium fandaimingii]
MDPERTQSKRVNPKSVNPERKSPVPAPESRRISLTLRRPWLGWHPRPTVVFGGRGQPAQWGTGTWQLPAGDTTISVFLYNRLWRYGEAVIELNAEARVDAVEYRAPALPFLRGTLREVAQG